MIEKLWSALQSRQCAGIGVEKPERREFIPAGIREERTVDDLIKLALWETRFGDVAKRS